MPYKFEQEKKKIPRAKKKTVKLSQTQREAIKLMVGMGESIHSTAKHFGVSRRLIQFIVYPERHERNKELRQERGGSKIYYDSDKHAESMRNHRKYKNQLNKNGELE